MLRPIASVVEVTYPAVSVAADGTYTATAAVNAPEGMVPVAPCSLSCSTPMVALTSWEADGSQTTVGFRAFATRSATWTARWLCLPEGMAE